MSKAMSRMTETRLQMQEHLETGILRFWLENGIDREHGGYLTSFDAEGKPTDDTDKMLVTQTRMAWGMAAAFTMYPEREDFKDAARQGFEFLLDHFWDSEQGGWFWKVRRDGQLIDGAKLVYGQSFAIYSLAQYTLSTGDPRGLDFAQKTFDLLQTFAADTYRGGYYENLEADWSVCAPGFAGGDRKSLDIHMHLMEAFTTLSKASGKEIHRRKLEEVIEVILSRMVDKKAGCGLNHFSLDFTPIPPIDIQRTWNAERATGEVIEGPVDSTSYGHNVELAWLLHRAIETLGMPKDPYAKLTRSLVDHSLKYGIDHTLGGVFRDGPHEGEAIVKDKEWWQNSEALVGYLDAYENFNDEQYLTAFQKTWDFANRHMINHRIGEWRQLLNREGKVRVGDIGNPWKAFYHSGRSIMECLVRLEQLAESSPSNQNPD